VLDALAIEAPKDLSGASLLALLEGAPSVARPSFAVGELSGELSGYDMDGRLLSLRANGHKWIWTSDHWLDSVRVPERWELYDLARDPAEQSDRSPEISTAPPDDARLQPVRELRSHLEAWRELTDVPLRDAPISPEVRKALRSIGY
jgi:arylsulfatase A-like enzyme